MNKKDFFYLVIIAGLIAFILFNQKPATPQQPVISETEINIQPDGAGDNHKKIPSQPTKAETQGDSNAVAPEVYKEHDQSGSLANSNNKRTTADTLATLRQQAASPLSDRFNEQRENEFKQAPPDPWGDDMKNEIETLYYTHVSQPGIEQFNAECKAKMCNIDLVLGEDTNRNAFSNISGDIFPPFPEGPNFMKTTVIGNTITIKADFDEPINIDDN